MAPSPPQMALHWSGTSQILKHSSSPPYPCLAAESPRTKKPNRPACVHICPALDRLQLFPQPPHGPQGRGPHPSCAPSPWLILNCAQGELAKSR